MWFEWLEIGGILDDGSDEVSNRPAKNVATKTAVRVVMLFMNNSFFGRLERS